MVLVGGVELAAGVVVVCGDCCGQCIRCGVPSR